MRMGKSLVTIAYNWLQLLTAKLPKVTFYDRNTHKKENESRWQW